MMIEINFKQLYADVIECQREKSLSKLKLSYEMDVEEGTLSRLYKKTSASDIGVLTLYKITKVLGKKVEDYIIDNSQTRI